MAASADTHTLAMPRKFVRGTEKSDMMMGCMRAGQSHDSCFESSRSGQMKHVLGTAKLQNIYFQEPQ